jgi:hypothetical protein
MSDHRSFQYLSTSFQLCPPGVSAVRRRQVTENRNGGPVQLSLVWPQLIEKTNAIRCRNITDCTSTKHVEPENHIIVIGTAWILHLGPKLNYFRFGGRHNGFGSSYIGIQRFS